jgi:chromosomal replication initiator protein
MTDNRLIISTAREKSMQGTIMDEGSRTAGPGAEAIAEALAGRIGSQKYKIWFQSCARFTLSDGYLKIGVPNPFMANWLESHFLRDIKAAAHAATGSHPTISFAVDSELPETRQRPTVERPSGPEAPLRRSPESSSGSKPLKLSLDTFVVGPTNELAYSAARAVVREQQSPFNPLFIHGGYGIGKTHLLQGICNGVAQVRPQTNWLYLSAEEFANQFVLALKTKKLEAFRARIRRTDLLAIDDIHFLASKPSTQEEFLHTFNTINLAGKQVVLV